MCPQTSHDTPNLTGDPVPSASAETLLVPSRAKALIARLAELVQAPPDETSQPTSLRSALHACACLLDEGSLPPSVWQPLGAVPPAIQCDYVDLLAFEALRHRAGVLPLTVMGTIEGNMARQMDIVDSLSQFVYLDSGTRIFEPGGMSATSVCSLAVEAPLIRALARFGREALNTDARRELGSFLDDVLSRYVADSNDPLTRGAAVRAVLVAAESSFTRSDLGHLVIAGRLLIDYFDDTAADKALDARERRSLTVARHALEALLPRT